MTGVSDQARESALPIKEQIKAEAEKLGFCLCGFTGPEPLDDFSRYLTWLEDDPVGTMGYLKREDAVARRADIRLLLPDVRTVCVLAVPMGLRPSDPLAKVASYARYVDYHEAIAEMAGRLAEKIRGITGEDFPYRICVDSAPVLERSLAVRAGLGWIGKSSMFISPRFGSALFLCEILMGIPIEADQPYAKDGCGHCTRCAEACPNSCIDPVSRTIRADRCAAYLTIEHKGEFTEEQAVLVGNHLFGCDECLAACPWNSRSTGKTPLQPADSVPGIPDGELSEAEFRLKFRNSPVLRTKAKGLRRNIEALLRNREADQPK